MKLLHKNSTKKSLLSLLTRIELFENLHALLKIVKKFQVKFQLRQFAFHLHMT